MATIFINQFKNQNYIYFFNLNIIMNLYNYNYGLTENVYTFWYTLLKILWWAETIFGTAVAGTRNMMKLCSDIWRYDSTWVPNVRTRFHDLAVAATVTPKVVSTHHKSLDRIIKIEKKLLIINYLYFDL